MAGAPSDSAQAEKRCSEFERFLSGTPSDFVETEKGCRASAKQAFFMQSDFVETANGCRENAKQAFRAPSDLTGIANGWKILARQELRMSNLRPRQELVQEQAGQNSELPADNRYNKHSCPNRYMKQWKGLLRMTQ